MNDRVIWQYWETKDHKPKYIDGLHALAVANAGVEVKLVTPSNLSVNLPNLPNAVLADLNKLDELAHKADIIRAFLIYEHGGMWLDSDAIVMCDLNFLFDDLGRYEFVGFNNKGFLSEDYQDMSVNCFLASKNSLVVKSWLEQQLRKLGKSSYHWTEFSADLLAPICFEHLDKVKISSNKHINPLGGKKGVGKFLSRRTDYRQFLDDTYIVMMSNKFLKRMSSRLLNMSVYEIRTTNTVIGHILNTASDPDYIPLDFWQRLKLKLTS